MDEILQSFRELVIRVAIVDAMRWNAFVGLTNSATNTKTLLFVQQTVDYESHQVRMLYIAHTSAFVPATVVILLGSLATVFLFWGWWKLGRAFSMNLLELVNALLVRETGAESGKGARAGMMASPALNAVDGQREWHPNHTNCYPKQQQQENVPTLANLPLLLNGSSNASKAQIVSHIKRKIRNTNNQEAKRKEDEKGGKRHVDVSVTEREDGSSSSRSNSGSREGRRRMKEPIIQYGVLDSTGRLGFAAAGAEGVIRAKCRRRRGML